MSPAAGAAGAGAAPVRPGSSPGFPLEWPMAPRSRWRARGTTGARESLPAISSSMWRWLRIRCSNAAATNLICPLPLTLAEAVLGGRIEVPTLSGPVTVRLPPGVQPGTRVRLAGRGVPSTRGDARGDLFLEVRIHIPEIRDDRSRDLVRELSARYPESPRDALREKLRPEDSR